MESIEKMRKELDVCGCDPDECLCCEVPRKVRDGLDEIEREIAERYMELPMDADGVPIHVGDELMTSEYGKRFTCTGYSYQTEGYEKPHWSIAYQYDDYDGTTEFVSLRSCRHVKPDPVKELLEEFAEKIPFVWDGDKPKEAWPYDSLMDEYAARIREAVGE